jgi:glycosyltransferase involved in cell wall biosynthesis
MFPETKPLSVLLISPAPAAHGGVVEYIETLKAHLKNCRVITCAVGSTSVRTESIVRVAARLLYTPLRIALLVSRGPVDLVHINPSLVYKALVRDGLILLAMRLLCFRNVLVYFHGWQWPVAERIHRNSILRRLFVWLLNGTASVTVLAPEFKEFLITIGIKPELIICTRTMFDGALLRSMPSDQPTTRPFILYMSRFIRGKGVHELLDAFAGIAAEFPGIDLVMAGAGEEENALRVKAAAYGLQPRIFFPGYVTGPEKYTLLQQCTLFVLPSFCEGLPIALLEAMAAGKPLLTSKVGAIPHYIREPDNGIVLTTVSIDSIQTALRQLLSNPDYCHSTGEHNKAYAWQKFEASIVTQEMEALYLRIAAS